MSQVSGVQNSKWRTSRSKQCKYRLWIRWFATPRVLFLEFISVDKQVQRLKTFKKDASYSEIPSNFLAEMGTYGKDERVLLITPKKSYKRPTDRNITWYIVENVWFATFKSSVEPLEPKPAPINSMTRAARRLRFTTVLRSGTHCHIWMARVIRSICNSTERQDKNKFSFLREKKVENRRYLWGFDNWFINWFWETWHWDDGTTYTATAWLR